MLIELAGDYRRGELVALDVEDTDDTDDGLRVLVRSSKTDQESEGRERGILRGQKPETDPVWILRVWRTASGIATGPLFRPVDRHDEVQNRRLSAEEIAMAVKRGGLDPSRYAGHSLRPVFATTAAAGGPPERAIMRQTEHRSVEMVRRHIGVGSLFQENAAAYVDL